MPIEPNQQFHASSGISLCAEVKQQWVVLQAGDAGSLAAAPAVLCPSRRSMFYGQCPVCMHGLSSAVIMYSTIG